MAIHEGIISRLKSVTNEGVTESTYIFASYGRPRAVREREGTMSWREYLRWHVVNSIADDCESINSFHEEMCQRTLAAKGVAPTVEEVLDILAELVDAGNAKAVRMRSQGPAFGAWQRRASS